jgi:hypothetical protein
MVVASTAIDAPGPLTSGRVVTQHRLAPARRPAEFTGLRSKDLDLLASAHTLISQTALDRAFAMSGAGHEELVSSQLVRDEGLLALAFESFGGNMDPFDV